MSEAFFTEVTGPIPFGGLDSDDPLAFKVYEPDRLVLGKRMEDHLRPGVCFWHSFAWPGVDMFGIGHARPAVARADRTTRWPPRGRRWPSRSSSSRSSARPTTASTTATSRPEGDSFATFRANLDALADDAAGYQERTGVRLLWGTANLFTPPALPGRRRHQPRSRGLRLRGGAGQAHARGHPAPGRRELRPVGRPRGLRHAAQHRPEARGRPAGPLPAPRRRAQGTRSASSGQLLIEPKPMEPTKHQYDYDVADRPRLPGQQRPRGRVPGQHRGQPRDAGRPQLPPRGRVRGRERDPGQHRRQPRRSRRTAGTPTSSRTRSRTWRCRCTRSCAAAGSRPAASTSTPSCAARAPTGTTCSTPTSAASTRSRGRCSSRRDLIERGELAALQGRALRRLGRGAWARRSWAAR